MGPQTQIPAGTRIVVAMSGGVDSSVAALLLKEQGMDVVGLSMRLWSYEKEATHGCCTPEDLYDARRVADFLEIPYFVTDFESIFETKVVSKFVDSYRMGETPNPCVRCNQDVKFNHLLRRSREMGAAFLRPATTPVEALTVRYTISFGQRTLNGTSPISCLVCRKKSFLRHSSLWAR